MRNTTRFMGHPLHPILIPFPIALWIFSLVSDLLFVMGMGGTIWRDVAFYTMVGGLAGGIFAAIPGYLDSRSVREQPAADLAWWHMVINLTVIGLYALNVLLRYADNTAVAVPILLSIVGVGLMSVSGWLGGEMVYVHGVAVEPASAKRREPALSREGNIRKRTGT